jgi:hypothetical protein
MANQVYLVDHTAKEYLEVYLSDGDEDLADCANPQDAFNFLWQRAGRIITVEYHATSQLDLWDGSWRDVG